MITCMECKHYPPKKEWPCVDCLDHDRYEKPQTTADRIRAMTDEELAKHHSKLVGCPKTVVAYRGYPAAPECKASACWLDWLKQETES